MHLLGKLSRLTRSDPYRVLPEVPCDQSRDEAPEVLALFVYGTLMSSGSEHKRIRKFAVGKPSWGSVPGSLFVSLFGDWPLLVPHPSGRVFGEAVPVVRVPELWRMLGDYEVAWGYELRWLPFLAEGAARGAAALTCVWPWHTQVGAAIPSGTWVT